MTGILDLYLKSAIRQAATSFDDVLGIALARALGDSELVDLYFKVARDYPHPVLAAAAKRWLRRGITEAPIFTSFYGALTHESFDGSGSGTEVVAVKVDRLAIGVAVLIGPRLSHTELRNLRYSDDDAVKSGAGLVRRLAEDYPKASLALEVGTDSTTRRARIIASVLQAARATRVPPWTLPPDTIYGALPASPCHTPALAAPHFP